MKTAIFRGLADALDRIGATLIALCLIGGWFSEQFPRVGAILGTLVGTCLVIYGVYTKAYIDKEELS